MSRKENSFSRRDFLKTAGAVGVGSLLNSGPAAAKIVDASGQQELVVPTRPFGKSGMEVSILSLGGMFDIPTNQLMLSRPSSGV